MGQLDGKTIAFVATDGVEQVELTEPWRAVEDEGATPVLISIEAGSIQGFNHLDRGDSFPVDATAAGADAGDYDGLVLPGGWRTRIACGPTRTCARSCAPSSTRGSRSA
jgi:protease I